MYSNKKGGKENREEVYFKCIILEGKKLKNVITFIIDFLNAVSKYETDEKVYKKLVSHGLPQCIKKEALIAVLCKYDFEPTTKYHEFPLIKRDDIKNNISNYDIPMYFEKIPSGFSPFCTLDEKRMVAKYYTHNALNYDENNIETIEVGKEPKPLKEHTFCHLCRVVYQDYLEHLETKTHKKNKKQNQDIYVRINFSFERIRTFWKDKNITNKKEIEEDDSKKIPKMTIISNKLDEITQSTAMQTMNVLPADENKAFVKRMIGRFKGKRKSDQLQLPGYLQFNRKGETKFVHNYRKKK